MFGLLLLQAKVGVAHRWALWTLTGPTSQSWHAVKACDVTWMAICEPQGQTQAESDLGHLSDVRCFENMSNTQKEAL